MAYTTMDRILTHPSVKLQCAAEVDPARMPKFLPRFPDVPVYPDWRKLLDKEAKNLDLVCIGTPDHMHAPIAMSAMQRGLPVYVQKPLTHDIHEARALAAMAREKKLVTQMGIQNHSREEYRTAVRLIQSGAIGKVKEVHCWSEKKWGDDTAFPDRKDSVPAKFEWDLWLGVAEERPYIGDAFYHPQNWRKRVDFGTATFGDMGCHIYDPVFASLELTSPISVRSEGSAPARHNWAINTVIHYVFPGTNYTAGKTVNVSWYDGDARPSKDVQALIGSMELPGQGSISIGTKGVMLLPHIGWPVLLPEKQFKGFEIPKMEGANHYHQFVDAVMGKDKTSAAFDYSGPLTEAVLLGPLATRFPKTTLKWNGAKLRFDGSPEASRFVSRAYRAGWSVNGLG